jgi:hypothetical protein
MRCRGVTVPVLFVVVFAGCGGYSPARVAASGAVPESASSGGGEALAFEALDKGQAFHVAVDAGGKRQECAQQVTYYSACMLTGVAPARALVHVTGTATFDREIPVAASGRATVSIGHRGIAFEVLSAVLFLAGAGAVALAWSDSHGFRGGIGDHVGDLLLTVAGTGLGAYGVVGFFVGVSSPHDELVVDRPGEPLEIARGVGVRLHW